MRRNITVGILDSGINQGGLIRTVPVRGRCFHINAAGEVRETAMTGDDMGHGTAVANRIIARSNRVRLVCAKIFASAGVTTAAQAAGGLNWLNGMGCEVINMSLGLPADRRILREACHKLIDAGVILVASMPARGAAVYPASYPGIIRVTGDARCKPGEISFLNSERHDFGACARPVEEQPAPRIPAGASMACACITATIAGYLADGGERSTVPDYLERISSYRGPERRQR